MVQIALCLTDAVVAEARSLPLRANVTIPECLLSVTISLGVVSDAPVGWRRTTRLRLAMPIKGETMKSSRWIAESHFFLACRAGLAGRRGGHAGKSLPGSEIHHAIRLVLIAAALAATPLTARSQLLLSSGDPSATTEVTNPARFDLTYIRPTERTKVSNYAFDAFGPYPIAAAGVTAGINQWTNSPPEWGQGVEGFGKRFGSDYAIAAIGTTTRYGLAEAFREDTLYYRCECSGPFPRLRHAVISTLTGRRGEDGHRVFSISALAAPYAGSMIAVHLWYPDRFDAKDAFRMGNYSLLSYMGGNIALEFFYSGPHALISRMHMNNTHGSPDPGPNH
jgi:hypothetical protein